MDLSCLAIDSGMRAPLLCFLQFMAWAKHICEVLIKEGHWADYIDPCSGLPVSLGMLRLN
jgi:hypothetical protein